MNAFTPALAILAAMLLVSQPVAAEEPAEPRLFVQVTGEAMQDQVMPLVLANQALDQGADVRVLLCGAGAELALADHQAPNFAPRDISAKDLLGRLIQQGATVEVCAIFLPNTEHSAEQLSEGIGIANPGEVAAWVLQPGVRTLGR
ncbi:MAG: DsrE family protein [Wenzhouxiangella sp.]